MNSRVPSLLAVFLLCGCFLLASLAQAQTPPAAPAAPAVQAAPAAPAAPPAEQKTTLPAPADKDLAFLLGKWETKIKIFPNALIGNTEELKGEGKAEYKVFGKVIEGVLTSNTSDGPYENREFIWFDPSTKAYNIIEISPEGYAINKKMSHKNSEKFVVEYTGVHKINGRSEVDFTVQAKYKIISDTEVKYYSEVKIGKANYVPFIQIKMQRVSN